MSAKTVVGIPYKGPVLVLFSGISCAPCEALQPLLAKEVTRRPGLQYVVLKPNEDSMYLYKQHGVRSSPTVLFLRDGKELGRFSGFRNADVLTETLNRWYVN